jgi:uncharacterized membrane protein YidH (DUF202 family)
MITRLVILAQLRRGDVNLPGGGALSQETADRVRGVALAVFGGIALVVVAYAGFKYVMSQGNPQETAKAQNTLMYAFIGLIVAILAVTVISFVIGRI